MSFRTMAELRPLFSFILIFKLGVIEFGLSSERWTTNLYGPVRSNELARTAGTYRW